MDWNKAQDYNQTTTSLPPEQLVALVLAAQNSMGFTGSQLDGMFGPTTRLEFARVSTIGEFTTNRIIDLALKQDGKPYRFGAEVDLNDCDPEAFDCSELVQWAAYQAGTYMPDGSWIQVTHCRDQGTLIDVSKASSVKGALLFNFSSDPFQGERPSSAHVAFSLGNGKTIEARSTNYGVGSWDIAGRPWSHAALIPR